MQTQANLRGRITLFSAVTKPIRGFRMVAANPKTFILENAEAVLTAIQAAIQGEGCTASQNGSLTTILDVASSLGGQLHVPQILQANDMLQKLKSEEVLQTLLHEACVSGAWVNIGANSGDYKNYQRSDTVMVKQLEDAVKSAGAFNDALELNGVVMTKLDGDARGGALLSVKHVTGVPIRFLGTGEHLEDLEIFRPEGMASRILGMGDMVALAQQAQSLVDEDEQIRMQEALEKGQFTLDDFRNHMQKMAKPGLMQKMMGLLPGMPNMKEINQMMNQGDTSKQIKQMVGMIDSMTPQERKNPKVIDISRRKRIAAGSGVQAKQVNELIKQYDTMKPMLTGMAGMDAGDRMKQMQDMQSQMMDPGRGAPKTKKSTGKRLSPKEKKKQQKEREKRLRQMRREKKK